MTDYVMDLVLELKPPLAWAPKRSSAEAAPKDDGAKPALADTIRAVADGDRDAFSQLYAAYVRMVHAILLGRVPRRDVDDLVQDVFVTA
jgi:hypothetical protein